MNDLDDLLEKQADQRSAEIDSALTDLEGDTMEVERVFNTVTDCLADLWVLNKDEKTRNRLIIQQLESALLNDAETTVEHRRS